MIVAIYARFSMVDLEKTSSIEAQIEMCRQKAIENVWVVDENHIYIDRAVSGSLLTDLLFNRCLMLLNPITFPMF